MAEQDQDLAEGLALPIDWHVSDNVISRYATNLTVQHTEHEFIVSFFEITPPLLLGSAEDRKAKAEQLSSVRANCIARIIVAAERMPKFVSVLQENLAGYLGSRTAE